MSVYKPVSLVFLIGLAGVMLFSLSCHHRPVSETRPLPAPAVETAPPPAPNCSLTAEPAALSQGQSATLTWTSTNATDLDLEPGLGPQQAAGSTSVTPQGSTQYTLTANGPGGTGTCNARVTVVPPEANASGNTAAQVSEENLAAGAASGMKDIFFDLDKADLRPDAQETLKADAEYLRAHPEITVEIQGNCDMRGSEEYNLGLGDRRADAARQFLVNLGIPPNRLKSISFGKDRPLCTDQTEDCWQKNRRDAMAIQTPGH